LIVLVLSVLIAAAAGASLMAEWPTLALYLYAPPTGGAADPIFGRPLSFYLFTLPAWQLITGWLLMLAVIMCLVAVFFLIITGSTQMLSGRRGCAIALPWRGFSIAFAFLLLVLAMRVYLSRFATLFEGHTIFSGVTYTDAHVTLAGLLVVCVALIVGAAIAAINLISAPRIRWLVLAGGSARLFAL